MGQKMNNISDSYYDEDGVHEECGVFGVYDLDGGDVASTIYYGLFALQHRGQESCGIAVSDTNGPKGKVLSHKDMGLVRCSHLRIWKSSRVISESDMCAIQQREVRQGRMPSHLFLTMSRVHLQWLIMVILSMLLI